MAADGSNPVQLTRTGGFRADQSPDGQWIYYTKSVEARNKLWKMPRDGGEETQVLESVSGRGFAVVSDGIYFIPAYGGRAIQFLNFTTKTVRTIAALEKPAESSMSVSRDGRWILFDQIDQS